MLATVQIGRFMRGPRGAGTARLRNGPPIRIVCLLTRALSRSRAVLRSVRAIPWPLPFHPAHRDQSHPRRLCGRKVRIGLPKQTGVAHHRGMLLQAAFGPRLNGMNGLLEGAVSANRSPALR
jgi:hypothetical protein